MIPVNSRALFFLKVTVKKQTHFLSRLSKFHSTAVSVKSRPDTWKTKSMGRSVRFRSHRDLPFYLFPVSALRKLPLISDADCQKSLSHPCFQRNSAFFCRQSLHCFHGIIKGIAKNGADIWFFHRKRIRNVCQYMKIYSLLLHRRFF